MKIRFRATATLVSATALLGAVLVGVAAPAAAAVPPYEPDPNSLGQLRFYDASGNLVTSGNIHDDPFAKYVVATTDDSQTANTTATLYAYTPVQGENALLWTGEQLSATTTFPVTDPTAPADVRNAGQHRPVVTMITQAQGDVTLAAYITDVPNANPPGSGWENLYQLRVMTPGHDPKYWEADVQVDPNTGDYTVVYPTATKDSSSLTIGKSSTIKYGSSITTSTTLKDTTTNTAIGAASVKLQRKSGTSWITVATKTTSSTGKASASVTPTGKTTYRWSYAGDSTHNAVNSASQAVSVAQVVSAHSTKSSVRHGTSFKIWGTVKPSSPGQKANLQRLSGGTWKTIGTATIKRQRLPNGSTTVGFVFTVRPTARGTFKYRAHKAATRTLVAGDSSTLTVRVT